MKKIYIQFVLISILILILIVPSAFFVNIIAHEYYHAYKNKPYSETICFDLTKPDKAYTIVNYPNLTAKLSYSESNSLNEEIKANNFGRTVSFLYLLFTGMVITLFLITINARKK